MASPYMSLSLPTVSVAPGPGWAGTINAAFSVVDAHDHSPGSGKQVRSASINLDADLSFNGQNAVALRTARLQNLAAPPALGTDVGCLAVSGGNLYYVNSSGQAIQLTSGAALNAASIGAIGGDYSTSSASEFYTSASQTFSLWQAANKSANLDCGNIVIREPGVSSPNGITIKSPTGLAGAYSLTLPAVLPGSTLPLTLTSAGAVSAASSLSLPGTLGVTGASTLSGVVNAPAGITTNALYQPPQAGAIVALRQSDPTSGIVYLNAALNRYLFFDGTYYYLEGAELRHLSPPTDPTAAATKGYVDARFVVAGHVTGSTGAVASQTGTVTAAGSRSSPGTYTVSVAGLTASGIVLVSLNAPPGVAPCTIIAGTGSGTFSVFAYTGTTSADADFSFMVVKL